jgi:hypothetical protein
MAMSEYMKKRQQHILDNRPLPKKEYKGIAKKSAKRLVKEAEEKIANSKEGKEESLKQWYEKIIKRHVVNVSGTCQECGASIPEEYMFHAVAHLLPKKPFRSIAMNDLNYLVLCAHNGCHQKTDRIDKFITMKTWPLAKEKINDLIKILPYDELKFISQQLYDALDNY